MSTEKKIVSGLREFAKSLERGDIYELCTHCRMTTKVDIRELPSGTDYRCSKCQKQVDFLFREDD